MDDVPQPRRRLFRPGDVSPDLVPATAVVTTFRLSDTSAQIRVLYRLAGRYPTAPASDGTGDPRLAVGHPADQLGTVVTLVRQVDPHASVTMSTSELNPADDAPTGQHASDESPGQRPVPDQSPGQGTVPDQSS
ncbi:MAG TPA: hypothetical protein VES21_15360 [Nocardioidaceae bacterium]|nr:hypothetical protein [Nocardioidaceae bacterium]